MWNWNIHIASLNIRILLKDCFKSIYSFTVFISKIIFKTQVCVVLGIEPRHLLPC